MTATGYFAHPFCSNSGLTKLGRMLGMFQEINADIEEAYRLGSLFDAVVTEPEKLDLIRYRIIDTDYTFTDAEYRNCRAMHQALKSNPLFAEMMRCRIELQKEIYMPSVSFCHEGITFSLSVKAKLDFYVPGMVSDLKSTAATTQSGFESSFIQFGYHRQMVLYCMLTGAKKAVVFAVSKVNKKVFVITMRQGDALWKAGEQQLNALAFKYYMLH